MVEEQVKLWCKRRGITLKKLAASIGMTEAGLHRALKKRTLKVVTLEKIADVLQVEIVQFFIGEGGGLSAAQEPLEHYQRNARLEERVARLEEALSSLERSVRRS